MSLHYPPEGRPEPPRDAAGAGEIVTAVALALGIGLAWELLLIQTDWRLGFSPPIWEIVVGWLGYSAFAAFVLMIVTLATIAFHSTIVAARNPDSWDARQSVFRVRRRAAAFLVGAGGLAAFGGLVMWVAGRMGPEFEAYSGFARFTAFMGAVAVAASILYLKRDADVAL